jgi:hypothetical protein
VGGRGTVKKNIWLYSFLKQEEEKEKKFAKGQVYNKETGDKIEILTS